MATERAEPAGTPEGSERERVAATAVATLESVARAALRRWSLGDVCVLELLKHRENAVFAVRCRDGARYALRVHRPGYHSDRALRSELRWMTALREAGVLTPEVVPTVDGELVARAAAGPGTVEYQCDLLSWVDGQPLGSAEERSYADGEAVARTYSAAGRLAALMHNHSSNWLFPADFERDSWDEAGCIGPSALWGDWGDHQGLTAGERSLLEAAVLRALEALAAFGKGADRYGLIHSDLVPDNLLDDGARTVIIDFDDCGFGWHLWELVTAVFWHFDSESWEPALRSFIGGYREHRPLPDEHLELLPVFLFVRGLVYIGWCHTRRETDTAAEIYDFVVSTTSAMAHRILGETSG